MLDKEAYVAVVSMEEEDIVIPLALRSIGAKMPEDGKDLFQAKLEVTIKEDGMVGMTVPRGMAYLIRCPLI